MPYTIRYHFSQHFTVPADAAYEWCTDYRPDDPAIMHKENAKREVTQLNDSTIILKETVLTDCCSIEKQKLVNLYPNRRAWISTHLSGPNTHSQFIYEILADGYFASRLNFSAFHIEYQENLTPKMVQSLTKNLLKEDSKVWKLLAEAMEDELDIKNSSIQVDGKF